VIAVIRTACPLATAKVEILERLRALGGARMSDLVDHLLGARSLRDLAQSALAVSVAMKSDVGLAAAEDFWNASKTILLRSRDRSTQAQ
jgi:hypothetical protein